MLITVEAVPEFVIRLCLSWRQEFVHEEAPLYLDVLTLHLPSFLFSGFGFIALPVFVLFSSGVQWVWYLHSFLNWNIFTSHPLWNVWINRLNLIHDTELQVWRIDKNELYKLTDIKACTFRMEGWGSVYNFLHDWEQEICHRSRIPS